MSPAGVELETPASEPDAPTTQPPPCSSWQEMIGQIYNNIE